MKRKEFNNMKLKDQFEYLNKNNYSFMFTGFCPNICPYFYEKDYDCLRILIPQGVSDKEDKIIVKSKLKIFKNKNYLTDDFTYTIRAKAHKEGYSLGFTLCKYEFIKKL